jgi:hypothetical protein
MLASRPALREHLRSAARAALLEQSWDKVVDRFEADLTDVVRQHRAKPAGSNFAPLVAPPTGTARLAKR